MGVEIDVKVPSTVTIATVKVHSKPCDAGTYQLVAADNKVIYEHDGYVPDWFPGDHCGDYLILDINIETGQILNWKKPTPRALVEWIERQEEAKS